MITKPENDETLDLVWGAKAIGELIQKPARQTFYLLENGALPARKVGSQWVASRSKLRAHLVVDEGSGA